LLPKKWGTHTTEEVHESANALILRELRENKKQRQDGMEVNQLKKVTDELAKSLAGVRFDGMDKRRNETYPR